MYPTYTDLRAAPQSVSSVPRQGSVDAEDAFASYRQFVAVSEPNLQVGWCVLPAGGGSSANTDFHELMIVLEGEVDFQGKSGGIMLKKGASVVIPKRASFTWRTTAPARLVFMRYAAEDAPEGADLVSLDPDVPLSPSGAPLAELLLSETPSCRNNTVYATQSRHWSVGVWDSTPYHRAPMVYGHYELMHILEGSVRITDDLGRATTFGQDSIFLVPKGAKCSWLSEEHVRKVWGILRIPS